jgi:hypothetical protein
VGSVGCMYVRVGRPIVDHNLPLPCLLALLALPTTELDCMDGFTLLVD